jgi:D-hexose-6-phosphate mutarotase
MLKIKSIYSFFLILAIAFNGEVVAKEKSILVSTNDFLKKDFEGLLAENLSHLKKHYYFSDNGQIVTLLEDLTQKEHNMLLIVTPAYVSEKFTLTFNGENLTQLKAKHCYFKVGNIDPKSNKVIGELEEEFLIGRWFTMSMKDSIQINFILTRGGYKYTFSSSKNPDIKWLNSFETELEKRQTQKEKK